MPPRSKRRQNLKSRRTRNNPNAGDFRSRNLPGDSNRRAATAPSMQAPTRTAMMSPPLFPASIRKVGQLYYEPGLGLTAPTSGNVVTYFFSANGMFDPNITGTGHQSMGFDQMMLLYEQTTVVRSTIEVTFNIGPGLTVQAGIAIFPDASGITDSRQLVENGFIRFIPLTSGSSTFQNQHMRTKLRMSCDVAKYFGRPGWQSIVNDANLTTTAAANPVEQVYYGIVAWQISPDGSTTTSIGFDVLLSFDSIYWEPRKLAVSISSDQREQKEPRAHANTEGLASDPTSSSKQKQRALPYSAVPMSLPKSHGWFSVN